MQRSPSRSWRPPPRLGRHLCSRRTRSACLPSGRGAAAPARSSRAPARRGARRERPPPCCGETPFAVGSASANAAEEEEEEEEKMRICQQAWSREQERAPSARVPFRARPGSSEKAVVRGRATSAPQGAESTPQGGAVWGHRTQPKEATVPCCWREWRAARRDQARLRVRWATRWPPASPAGACFSRWTSCARCARQRCAQRCARASAHSRKPTTGPDFAPLPDEEAADLAGKINTALGRW